MSKFFAIVAFAGLAASAHAGLNGTLETYADSNINGDAPSAGTTFGSGRTWNVRSSGVVGGTSGIRFMSIQGTGTGTFAGWGLIEFDPSEVVSFLNNEVANTPGGISWVITDAAMTAQQQSSQPFAAVGGPLQIIHVTDDLTSAASLSGSTFINQLGGATTVLPNFAYTNIPSNVFEFDGPGANHSTVIADWNSGTDPIRMIINPGNSTVVAPFKGSSSPFQGINAPSFRLSYSIIVPAPGAVAAFGLAGLVATRRRRA